jgi:hypothetical protein
MRDERARTSKEGRFENEEDEDIKARGLKKGRLKEREEDRYIRTNRRTLRNER